MDNSNITDDFLAEIEVAYMAGWQESGEGWNAEYPETDEAAEMVCMAAKRMAHESPLIARIRALESTLQATADYLSKSAILPGCILHDRIKECLK